MPPFVYPSIDALAGLNAYGGAGHAVVRTNDGRFAVVRISDQRVLDTYDDPNQAQGIAAAQGTLVTPQGATTQQQAAEQLGRQQAADDVRLAAQRRITFGPPSVARPPITGRFSDVINQEERLNAPGVRVASIPEDSGFRLIRGAEAIEEEKQRRIDQYRASQPKTPFQYQDTVTVRDPRSGTTMQIESSPENVETWTGAGWQVTSAPPPAAQPTQGFDAGAGQPPGASGPASQLIGEFRSIYDATKNMIDELNRRGQAVNPNVQITPERVAEFMKQAETGISEFLPIAEREVLPYFQNQLKIAREDFLRNVGYSTDDVLRKEQELERVYGQRVRGVGEQTAEQGFAQSGARTRAEQELARGTQEDIAGQRRQLGFNVGTTARGFAQRFGANALPGLSLTEAPQAIAGQEGFQKGIGSRQLYELSPDVYDGLTGEQEFAQRGAVRQRASDLERSFRENEALRQQRQLTL